MNIEPVGMGVLGYGHYIRTNLIKVLRRCPEIRILGVYNRGEERRKQAQADGFFATSDLDELLSLPGLEAVLVGTANAVHKEHAIRAARAGKHILCEKPLALSLEDVDEMVAEAEKAGVITHVNHGSPYGESFMKFRELAQNEAGEILHFWKRSSRAFGLWIQGARHDQVAHPEESGGWTFHHLCHQLNEACLIINRPARTVYHVMQKSCPECPSEEFVNSLLTFEGGATALLTDGTTLGPFNDMGVIGTRADIRLLDGTITVVTPGPSDPTQRPGNLTGITRTYRVRDTGKNLDRVFGLFAWAVRGGKNELLSFRFIRDQYKILMAMKKSAETGQVIAMG
ncbi:MAG: Gfo/Idh/MocA family oxidoreductase [Kiritimatiellae bacterium]|nr:Gfo/Idh/MocA family oxidoreductase [Kiritimatiellia bacterium]